MDGEIRVAFGMRVRALRTERGVSLRQFALMIGIDKGFLVDVELGRKSPTLDTIAKIAAGLDVSLSELFEGITLGNTEKKRPCTEKQAQLN